MSEKVASPLEQAEIFMWSSKFSKLEWPTCFVNRKIRRVAMPSRMAYPLLPSRGVAQTPGRINLAAQENS